MPTTPLLSVAGMSKTFPGVRALDDVSLSVASGEIVAIVGHNGSGKSTLVKILAGVYQPDPGGTIEVRDAEGQIQSAGEARDELHFIHQDLGLIDILTTVENLGLDRATGAASLSPIRAARERRHAAELIHRFGADFDPSVPVAGLSAAERAIVAIARALDGWERPDSVLILDEPTTAFHGDEVNVLFEAIRRIAADGAGIVFISHRLDEVLGLADRVIVLRDGRVVADEPASGLDHDRMVELVAGRAVAEISSAGPKAAAEPMLTARGLSGRKVRDLSLTVSAGEIVGVSGILGSGREELAGLLFGAQHRFAGRVEVGGDELPPDDRAAAIEFGLAYAPSDRWRQGAVMEMNMRENLTLPAMSPLRRLFGRLDRREEWAESTLWARRVGLKPLQPDRPLRLFSGGNQQKVVLAKWLRTRPRVLLLDEPTQGVDVGAKAAIYQMVLAAAEGGTAVLVCSSDAKELVTLCDRVLVLDGGEIASEVKRSELTEARLVRDELKGRDGVVA